MKSVINGDDLGFNNNFCNCIMVRRMEQKQKYACDSLELSLDLVVAAFHLDTNWATEMGCHDLFSLLLLQQNRCNVQECKRTRS